MPWMYFSRSMSQRVHHHSSRRPKCMAASLRRKRYWFVHRICRQTLLHGMRVQESQLSFWLAQCLWMICWRVGKGGLPYSQDGWYLICRHDCAPQIIWKHIRVKVHSWSFDSGASAEDENHIFMGRKGVAHKDACGRGRLESSRNPSH